jgi:hypothetical protein
MLCYFPLPVKYVTQTFNCTQKFVDQIIQVFNITSQYWPGVDFIKVGLVALSVERTQIWEKLQ